MAGNVEDKKPKIHENKETGMKYLRGKDSVLFEDGTLLSRDEFEGHEVSGLRRLIEDTANEDKYDFSYACSTGQLRRKRGYASRVVIGHIKPRPVEEQREVQTNHLSTFLIMVVMTIVGVGSAIMSAYHTSTFLIIGGKPVWTALTTGIMLILFSATAFTAARYFFRGGGIQNFFGVLFVIAGLAIISYSMFSTLTVNFEQFQWRTDERTAYIVQDNEELLLNERLLYVNQNALNEINAHIERLRTSSDHWRTVSWRRYDEVQVQMSEAIGRRDELREVQIRLESFRPELVAQAGVSRQTIYTFLGALIGLQEDNARFFVYVLPACLYDILAPFALSVVLFLLDKRRKVLC